MAWLMSAMNKSNLTRAVKNYTDSVVQQAGQAVAEGAKLLQDRIVSRKTRKLKKLCFI